MAAEALAFDREVAVPQKEEIPLNERLIVALDVHTTEEAWAVVKEMGETVQFYKVGLGLQFIGGLKLARDLKDMGKKVFLDTKIYDIGATTRAAVRGAADLNVDFLTVHGTTSVLREAVAGRGDRSVKLFLITALTSLDDSDLKQMAYPYDIREMVRAATQAAMEAKIDGVITSGHEAQFIKEFSHGQLLIVTPGIRSAGVETDDQKRVATPESAIEAGADYLVMGRQILRSSDKKREAQRVVDAIAGALHKRGD